MGGVAKCMTFLSEVATTITTSSSTTVNTTTSTSTTTAAASCGASAGLDSIASAVSAILAPTRAPAPADGAESPPMIVLAVMAAVFFRSRHRGRQVGGPGACLPRGTTAAARGTATI